MARTHPGTVLALLLSASILAGCDSSQAEPTPTAASPTTESRATPTQTPTVDPAPTTTEPPTLSPEEQDQADIEATVVAYMAALDEAYAGGDIEGIYPWSRDIARDQWTTQIMAEREQGLTITGETEIEVREVEVNGDQADVLACVDYSDITVTQNEHDITPDRETGDLIVNDYVLEREESAEYGWLVVDDASRSEPCDA